MNYGEAFATLNRRIFLGLDQETLRREVLARLATRYPDVRINQVMEAIIDVATYGIPAVAFHVDRGTTEACFATATLADSVSRLARALYGYKASGAGAAAVDCTVAPASAQVLAFTLPAGHAFSGPRGTKWLLADALSWAEGDTSAKACTLIQHEKFQVSARGAGIANQEVTLGATSAKKPLQDGSVVVYVSGAPWAEVDALTPDAAASQYEVDALRAPARVRFGDGVAGGIPDQGVPITIEYAVTMAEKGGIVAADVLKADKLVVSGHAVSFVVAHSGSSGGTAPESLEQVRRVAPRHRATAERAITRSDYVALAEGYVSAQYGSVAAASVVDGRNVDPGSASLLEEIRGAIDQQATALAVEIDRITAALAAISAIVSSTGTLRGHVAAVDTANDDIAGKLTSIGLYGTAATTSLDNASRAIGRATSRNDDSLRRAGYIKNGMTTIDGQLSVVANLIMSSGASLESKWAVQEHLAAAAVAAAAAASDANSLDAAYATLATELVSAASAVTMAQAAVDNAKSVSTSASEQVVLSSSQLALALSDSDVLVTHVAAIAAAAAELAAKFVDLEPRVVDITNRLGGYLENALLGHEANIVSVSLLCLDADGYYTAPTNGLIRSIEGYLTGKSAPNVLVRAVSGAPSLIRPTISVMFLETPDGVPGRIAAEMASLLAARLRRRPAGEGIALSELYRLIDDEVEFVKWYSVSISAPDSRVDANGNLVIASHEFVTLGTIEIRHWLTPTSSEALVSQ